MMSVMNYIRDQNQYPMTPKAVKDMLVGALVGIVSMLPGASGATIAVIFGIYERLVSDLADIRRKLLRDLRFVIPLGIGIVLGLFVCAFGLDALMERWEVPMMFFFAALILAQIPDVKALGDDGTRFTAWNAVAFIGGFAVMAIMLAFSLSGGSVEKSVDGFAVWFLVGLILAASKMAPGISGSTILLALGLFTPFMNAMTDFEMSALIPGGLGLLVGVLLFAKILDNLIRNRRKSTYMAILGLTAGSVVTVAIEACTKLDGGTMIAQSAAMIVVGLVLGVFLSRISRQYAAETIASEPEE